MYIVFHVLHDANKAVYIKNTTLYNYLSNNHFSFYFLFLLLPAHISIRCISAVFYHLLLALTPYSL